MMNIIKKIMTVAAWLMCTQVTWGQTPILTPEQAIAKALQHNLQLRTVRAESEYAMRMQKTVREVPATSIMMQLGPYNSARFDNALTVTQGFSHPQKYVAGENVWQAEAEALATKAQVTEKELAFQIYTIFEELYFWEEKLKYLQKADSLYKVFEEMAKVRVKVGEGMPLEIQNAGMKRAEWQYEARKVVFTQQSLRLKLQELMGDNQLFIEAKTPFFSFPAFEDSLAIAQHKHLYVQLQHKQENVALKEYERQKTALLPDFNVGIFSQTLTGPQTLKGKEVYFNGWYRFSGVYVGADVPIFRRATKEKLQAAEFKISIEKMKTASLEYGILMRKQGISNLLKQQYDGILYYQNTLLPYRTALATQTLKAFQSGDVGFREYLWVLAESLDTEMSLLENVWHYRTTRREWDFYQSTDK